MKKIMLFAAACVALAACSKEIDTNTSEIGNGTAFEKGQKVTLTVRTGDQTKVSSELVTSGEDKDNVNFAWETGDKIKVTVGTKSAEFTLSSGAGTATAEFTGTMPAAGETFDVQYPVDDPDLSSQTYVTNGLPKDKMKMIATNCTVAGGFTLSPQFAVLRLNLYGTSKTISKIEVKDASSNAYTLAINPAVTLPTTNATAQAFFVVVPVGSYKFSAEIFDYAATPASICKFEPTVAQTFTTGKIVNMPAKEVIEYVPVTDIELASSSIGLLTGSSAVAAPTVTFTPSNATDQTCTWTSDNPNVVTVDSVTGALTPVADGQASVWVEANGGNASAGFDVYVIHTPYIITVAELASVNSWEEGKYYKCAPFGWFDFSDMSANGWRYSSGKMCHDDPLDLLTISLYVDVFEFTSAYYNSDSPMECNPSYVSVEGDIEMTSFTLNLKTK